MTLIASISGVRGTLGGAVGQNLTPPDVVRFAAAFGTWVQQQQLPPRVVLGRDARPSGPAVQQLVANTLVMMGFDVLDLGLSTTPTVELAVKAENASGGIILTASHNPIQWNALKLLNRHGEFVSARDGERILELYAQQNFSFAPVEALGRVLPTDDYLAWHLQHLVEQPLVEPEAIARRKLKVVVDAVNSSGGIYVPALLRALGVDEVVELNCLPNGQFAHNPEPLPEHLQELCAAVRTHRADLGIAVDPDVDRLALVDENGQLFGEEYTLVALADYVLSHTPGPVVNNLSSSRALRDVAQRYGQPCISTPVGEVNVVVAMKEHRAVLGGEGNGGIIYPPTHYGRDALVGIALFLSHLCKSGLSASQLRSRYPTYAMFKHKLELPQGEDPARVLEALSAQLAHLNPDLRDGVKIDFADRWVHLRRSNTEPIVRIYTEAPTEAEAHSLAVEYEQKLLAAKPLPSLP